MKAYIAADSQVTGALMRDLLHAEGLTVYASWIEAGDFGLPKTKETRMLAAQGCYHEIDLTDITVLIHPKTPCKGGCLIEAGYAMAAGKTVLVVGKHTSTMLYDPRFIQCPELVNLIAWIRRNR